MIAKTNKLSTSVSNVRPGVGWTTFASEGSGGRQKSSSWPR